MTVKSAYRSARRIVLIACMFAVFQGIRPPLFLPATAAFAQESNRQQRPSDATLRDGAEARIEKYRKAEVEITIVDAAGNPVNNATVTVEQTRHAFLFGSNIFGWGNAPSEKLEADYRAQYRDALNFATLAFYWPMYEAEQGKPMHARTEKVAQWCRANNITTKGHPLAWNLGDPRWLPDDFDEIRGLQMARIDDCVSHFEQLIDRWDVVNEATHFERSNFADARSPKFTAMWKDAGRMEFTRECFEHARKSGPKATLLINDYRTDPAYEKVIEQLVDEQGTPMYDVIGIQSHMHGGAWTNRKIWDVCERFSRFGVPLHFTEATIISGQRDKSKVQGDWKTTAEGEAYQAEHVERVYTMLFSHPSVEAITWWDFSDHRAWQGAPAGFLRKDMSPKPAYHVLKRLVKETWSTNTTVSTNANGTATFRGFLGDYDVSVNGKQVAASQLKIGQFKIGKKGTNRWVIEE